MSLTVLKPQTKTSLVRWKRLVTQGIGPTWMAPKKERIMIMSSNGCVPCSVCVLLHLWVHSDNAIEECGQSWVSGKLFPWKQMLPWLATSGLVLVNWPDVANFWAPSQHIVRAYQGSISPWYILRHLEAQVLIPMTSAVIIMTKHIH